MKKRLLFYSIAILIFLCVMAGCESKNEGFEKKAGQEETGKASENTVMFFETAEKETENTDTVGNDESVVTGKNEEEEILEEETELPEEVTGDFSDENGSESASEENADEDEVLGDEAEEDSLGFDESEDNAAQDDAFYDEDPSEEDLM